MKTLSMILTLDACVLGALVAFAPDQAYSAEVESGD